MPNTTQPQKRGPKPRPASDRRTAHLHVAFHPDWLAWFRSVAETVQAGHAELVALAMSDWAERRNLPKPPRR
jgi:hypothetical protein